MGFKEDWAGDRAVILQRDSERRAQLKLRDRITTPVQKIELEEVYCTHCYLATRKDRIRCMHCGSKL